MFLFSSVSELFPDYDIADAVAPFCHYDTTRPDIHLAITERSYISAIPSVDLSEASCDFFILDYSVDLLHCSRSLRLQQRQSWAKIKH